MLPLRKFRPVVLAIRTDCLEPASKARSSTPPRSDRLKCQRAPDRATAPVAQRELKAQWPALILEVALRLVVTGMAVATAKAFPPAGSVPNRSPTRDQRLRRRIRVRRP